MKETGIIMSGNHPRLTLDGLKTMTRRTWGLEKINENPNAWFGVPTNIEGALWRFYNYNGTNLIVKCPYGGIGDLLWMRETWRIESFIDGEPLLFSYKDGQTMEENEYNDTLDYESWYERVCIQSTEDAEKAFKKGLVRQDEGGMYRWDIGKSPCRWRSSRFMPRWASRGTPEIISLGAERLQEIKGSDIIQEGYQPDISKPEGYEFVADFNLPVMRSWFQELWDSLNAKRGYSWEFNPWAWPIGYRLA